MDNEFKNRGRKPIDYSDENLTLQQKKRHEYYLNFKNKHPFYYKKLTAPSDDQKKKPHQFLRLKIPL